MKKITCCLTVIIIILSITFCITVAASVSDVKDSQIVAESIILGVGSNETERCLAYFSDMSDGGEVWLAKSNEIVDGCFPKDHKTFYPITAPASNIENKYAKAVTLTGLVENTKYAYVITANDVFSDIYYFNTDGSQDYEFVFVGDPQLSTQPHALSWNDTLKKISKDLNVNILISAGDQVTTPDSEEHYSYLTQSKLASIAFAPTVGPSHDSVSSTFKDHYNLPNLSEEYGANETSANYWYTYNNTLFMHLNMSDSSAATNGEHKSFMKEAIELNPGITWKIVVMHNSLFSTGMHGDPNYKYYESEIGKYRPALAPIFNELDIDIVLSGHDHVYLRTHMMNGLNQSSDVIENNTTTSPEGVLYLCASSSSGSKFYDQFFEADFSAYDNYEKRKSAVKFSVTDSSITLNSYFLDDMSVFDTFTIYKTPHVCSLTPVKEVPSTCTEEGKKAYYTCKCGRSYQDAEGSTLINNISTWGVIKMKEHEWRPATCTVPGMCAGCRKINEYPEGHIYSDKYDKTCNICQEIREAPDKPNTNDCTGGETDNSPSSDKIKNTDNGIPLIIGVSIGALVLISAAAAIRVFVIKRKK